MKILLEMTSFKSHETSIIQLKLIEHHGNDYDYEISEIETLTASVRSQCHLNDDDGLIAYKTNLYDIIHDLGFTTLLHILQQDMTFEHNHGLKYIRGNIYINILLT